MTIEIRLANISEIGEIAGPLVTQLGVVMAPERVARLKALPELELAIGAYEDGAVAGGMGSYQFSMMVPAAEGVTPLPIAGLTVVGVQPTHRRRGVLRGMLKLYFEELRRRGRCVSALFASEGSIYGRFGYGMASFIANADIERDRSAFRTGPQGSYRMRLVSEDEAAALFPRVWERLCAETPGMLTRSEAWWRARRLMDPDWVRGGRGALQRVLLEENGEPVAYALYRHAGGFDHHLLVGSVDVSEALGVSPAATRAIWRYLLDIDLAGRIKATLLPVDHPLLFLAAEVRRLRMYLSDGLWVRLVDVEAALAARGYGSGGALTLEVTDSFCPWNEGRYTIEGSAVRRTDAAADLALDVETLGALYLGAHAFTALADAGRVTELKRGALRRADALFRAARAPFCPEMF